MSHQADRSHPNAAAQSSAPGPCESKPQPPYGRSAGTQVYDVRRLLVLAAGQGAPGFPSLLHTSSCLYSRSTFFIFFFFIFAALLFSHSRSPSPSSLCPLSLPLGPWHNMECLWFLRERGNPAPRHFSSQCPRLQCSCGVLTAESPHHAQALGLFSAAQAKCAGPTLHLHRLGYRRRSERGRAARRRKEAPGLEKKRSRGSKMVFVYVSQEAVAWALQCA